MHLRGHFFSAFGNNAETVRRHPEQCVIGRIPLPWNNLYGLNANIDDGFVSLTDFTQIAAYRAELRPKCNLLAEPL